MSRRDTIVIGGGIAGSAAAIWLARGGKQVLLLEKEPTAHHKVCGEFISHEALYYLERLGIDIAALGAVPVQKLELIHGRRRVTAKLPFRGMSLSRHALDEALIERAAASGAEVRRGVGVSSVTAQDRTWKVETADASFEADHVFLATGKRDLQDMPRDGGWQNNFIGFKMHYRLAPYPTEQLSGKVQMILFKGGYAGLELIEDGIANLCLVVKKSRFVAIGKQWEKLLTTILQETPALAEQLSGARSLWEKPLAIFGIPYGFIYRDRPDAPTRFYRLGDQMAVIPSFSGDGMAIALHTAALAANAPDAASYHRQARAGLLFPMRCASLVSLCTTSSACSRLTSLLACQFPCLLTHIAVATRLKHFGTMTISCTSRQSRPSQVP